MHEVNASILIALLYTGLHATFNESVLVYTCRYDSHWISGVLLLLFFYGLYYVYGSDQICIFRYALMFAF